MCCPLICIIGGGGDGKGGWEYSGQGVPRKQGRGRVGLSGPKPRPGVQGAWKRMQGAWDARGSPGKV
jgi:hypothetical protein